MIVTFLLPIKKEEIPHRSAINSTLRQVSGAISSSIFIALMTSVTKYNSYLTIKLANIKGMNASFAGEAAVALIASIIYVKDKY